VSLLAAVADALDPPPRAGWTPQPKQALATELASQVDDLLYGGAVGGGKTEWLMEYLIGQCTAYATNRVLVLRRVFPSLNRTIIPRLKAKLHGLARWNGQEHTFSFANGSVLECGSVQYADDVLDFQGTEYGCVAFEEITEFMQSQVEFMIGRLRSTVPGVRPHLIATTNPGGTGHAWVKRWWVKPKPDDVEEGEAPPKVYEPWRPAASPEVPRPRKRVYVPATLEDNPALLQADPGYPDRVLAQANRGKRQAYRWGDWDAIDQVEGALWDAATLDVGRVRPGYAEQTVGIFRRVVALDPSDGLEQGGDAFGVCHAGRGADGVGYVLGSWSWRASPGMMARQAVALYHEVGADALVVERNHGGKWMTETLRNVDDSINVVEVWASESKRTRAEPVAALFEPNPHRLLRVAACLAGFFEQLESELCNTEFAPGMVSPNELDAMVWALHELCLKPQARQHPADRDRRLEGRR
jgi:hypothetical protein